MDITAEISKVKVSEELFKDVKYHITGSVSPKVVKLLTDGGAKQDAYISDCMTHLITGEDPDENEIEEVKAIYEKPVVTERWVVLSAKCGEQLPWAGFSPPISKVSDLPQPQDQAQVASFLAGPQTPQTPSAMLVQMQSLAQLPTPPPPPPPLPPSSVAGMGMGGIPPPSPHPVSVAIDVPPVAMPQGVPPRCVSPPGALRPSLPQAQRGPPPNLPRLPMTQQVHTVGIPGAVVRLPQGVTPQQLQMMTPNDRLTFLQKLHQKQQQEQQARGKPRLGKPPGAQE